MELWECNLRTGFLMIDMTSLLGFVSKKNFDSNLQKYLRNKKPIEDGKRKKMIYKMKKVTLIFVKKKMKPK